MGSNFIELVAGIFAAVFVWFNSLSATLSAALVAAVVAIVGLIVNRRPPKVAIDAMHQQILEMLSDPRWQWRSFATLSAAIPIPDEQLRKALLDLGVVRFQMNEQEMWTKDPSTIRRVIDVRPKCAV